MIERNIERLFFASRWLLAPVYLGLSVALVVLGIKFFAELWHALAHVMALSEAEVVLAESAASELGLRPGEPAWVLGLGAARGPSPSSRPVSEG